MKHNVILCILISLAVCTKSETSFDITQLISRTTKALIETAPSFSILMPAYILYADQQKLACEPVDADLAQRIQSLLLEAGLTDIAYLPCKKLNTLYVLKHDSQHTLNQIVPLKRHDSTIVALPSPQGLLINEAVCKNLDDHELRLHILPCALFIKHRVLEKSIITAFLTPIATDFGTRILSYLIKICTEIICIELTEKHPLLSYVLCNSNTTIEWLLTNFVTKFILNTRMLNVLTQKNLQNLDEQVHLLLEHYYEKNPTAFSPRGSKNSCR